MKYIAFLLLAFPSIPAISGELKPFKSDGCSAFPDGTMAQNELWLGCCTLHDYKYWLGGTYADRLRADKDLQQCVSKVGEPEIALLMLAGVRVGGTPLLPTQFRWGYGWDYPRFYRPLTASEVEQVKNITTGQE
ncbi:MAG: hypothetical protein QGG88_09785 [Gammaproteobacteria bacterium]|nr:hypothetical protein [Gammaproteobacteria bacterium]